MQSTIICTVKNIALRYSVNWIIRDDGGSAKFASSVYMQDHKIKRDIQISVAQLKDIGCGQKKNLVKEDLVRIDMQGTFPREGKRWVNIQAQLNISIKEPTTVAATNVEVESEG